MLSVSQRDERCDRLPVSPSCFELDYAKLNALPFMRGSLILLLLREPIGLLLLKRMVVHETVRFSWRSAE